MSTKFKKSLSLSLLALLFSNVSGATQLIENADKQHVQVNISARETNRLAIEGRRIANVVPAQPGLISGKKDEAQGVLYFSMASDQAIVGTMTLFVTDDRNTSYKLVLVPRPIGGEEIIIRPPAEKQSAVQRKASGGDGRAANYQRRAKELIVVMADSEAQDGALVEKIDVNKEVPLWQEARLVLVSKFVDADLIGEKYSLTNVSRTDMLLVEQELYRKGVRAISIRNQTLAPGDNSDIYIVRERKDNE